MSVIEEKRKEIGLTITGLAEKLSVSRPTIYAFERFESEPTIPQLIKLSRILGVGITTIIKDYAKHYKNKEV
jgi:predicted transcriptional regulator